MPTRVFRHGHFHREILDVIRQADGPLTSTAIAERLAAKKPEIAGNARGLGDLVIRVRRALGRSHAGLVRDKVGRDASEWRAAEDAIVD